METASTLRNVSIQIRRHPIDGADDIARFADDSLDDSEMKDANTGLAFTFHSFDGNSIPWLYLGRPLCLAPFLPTKHPHSLADETLVLVLYATPRRSYNPIPCHDTPFMIAKQIIKHAVSIQ